MSLNAEKVLHIVYDKKLNCYHNANTTKSVFPEHIFNI